MLNNAVHQAILELVEEIEKILAKRIDEYGYNVRAKENTLKGSDLEKSIEVRPLENGVALAIADYWEYVARGWHHSGKSGARGLYHALVLWALKKHIKLRNYTQNESAMIVAANVWEKMIIESRDIKARPFMRYDRDGDLEKMIPQLKAYMQKWFDNLFQKIMQDIDKYFNK